MAARSTSMIACHSSLRTVKLKGRNPWMVAAPCVTFSTFGTVPNQL